ncbi:MAG: hypothetical protein ACI3ZZ_06855 [Candidatus Aphodosoma sp.]
MKIFWIFVLVLYIVIKFVAKVKTQQVDKDGVNKKTSTSASRQSSNKNVKRDVVSNDDDRRSFDDFNYDELIKVMSEEEIKRRYPAEYTRHINDMMIKKQQQAEAERKRKTKRNASTSFDPVTRSTSQKVDSNYRMPGNGKSKIIDTSDDNSDVEDSLITDAVDFSNPDKVRAAFIASEVFNKKYN